MSLTKVSGSILKDPLNLGHVSIGGTLTYQDVTNVDSVGIGTFRSGIHVGAGVSAVGIGTFSGLDISGDIDVDGHTELDNVNIAGVATITDDVTTEKNILTLVGTSWGDEEKVFTTYKRGAVDLGRFGVEADGAGQAGQLIFECGYSGSPVERVRITSDGKVGINTTTPDTQLEVFGGSTSIQVGNQSGLGRFGADGTSTKIGSHSNHPLDLFTNGVANTRLRITTDGKVGVNQSTWTSKDHMFEVNQSTNDKEIARFTNTGGTSGSVQGKGFIGLSLFNTTTHPHAYIGVEEAGTGNYEGNLTFATRNASNDSAPIERLRITSSGNALFTTNQVKLYNATDNSNTYFYTENTGAGNAGIKMKNQDGEWTIIANDSLRFIDDDTSADRLRIHSGGKLQTYNTFTSSASSFLQLGDAQGVFEVQMSDGTGGADVINHVKKRFVSKNTYGLNITSRSTLGGSYTKAGEASIKFYYPSAGGGNQAGGQLEFWTNQNGYAGTNESKRMQIDNGGNIGAPNGNNIYNASDERLKENMVELTNGLDKIKKLKPISFNWKEGWVESLSGKKEYGFGAQTTQVVDEMLVEPFGTEDALLNGETIENPLRVNEKYITPLLVKAIQEQQEQIETLKAEVAALKSS